MSGNVVGLKDTVVTSGILNLTVGFITTGFIFRLGNGGVFIFIIGSIIKGTPLSFTGWVPTNP